MRAADIARSRGGGIRNGRGWLCRCPIPSHGKGRGDRNPSLSLADGDNGRLVVHCFSGCDPRDVLRELLEQGLIDGPVRGLQPPCEVKPVVATATDDDSAGKAKAALRIWRESRPAMGTAVDAYLCGRAITRPIPLTIRFHPDLWHTEAHRSFPAMVAAVQGPCGRMVAVHRTYLSPDGSGKAPVTPAKKILGPSAGGAVRLAKAGRTLQVAEGIETALAALQATAQPTWAALSTSGLRALVLPSHVRRVTILADGDDPGEAAARDCAFRWAREGRRVRIARPPRGMDFNDLLMGRAPRIVEGA